jgi:hypothetical protein
MSTPLFLLLPPFKFVWSLGNSSLCALDSFFTLRTVCSVCGGAHSDILVCADKAFAFACTGVYLDEL